MSERWPDPYQQAEAIKAALAEAGYPHADVDVWDHADAHGDHVHVLVEPSDHPGAVPGEVLWRAFHIVDPDTTRCRACWMDFSADPDALCEGTGKCAS